MVNENLYNWIHKTYGIRPAEWYRNNPNAKPGANPFLPRGAYVPLASAGGDPQKALATQTYDLQRSSGTLASVSPDLVQRSVVEPPPKPKAPKETPEQRAERVYKQALEQVKANQKPSPALQKTAEGYYAEVPATNYITPNVYYSPAYGEYGGYFSRENLGYSLGSKLYKRYAEAADRLAPYPTGGDMSTYMDRYNAASQQRTALFEQLYKTPLENAKYKSTADAPSRAAYRQQLVEMGFEIPLVEGNYSYFDRAATPEDYEVQQYGLENVGREDYRQRRASEKVQNAYSILWEKEQANMQSEEKIEEFENKLLDQAKGEAVDWSSSKGPRGELIAQAPSSNLGPRGMDRPPGSYHPSNIMPLITPGSKFKPGEGYMIQNPFDRSPQTGPGLSTAPEDQQFETAIATAAKTSEEQKAQGAFQSEYDPQKAKAASAASKEYRRQAQSEDPFRQQAVFG